MDSICSVDLGRCLIMTEKILIVDDEAFIIDSLRRELGSIYKIETAMSGAEGLDKLTGSGPFAVVLSDYRMPKMDGVQFLTKVMEIAPETVRMMLTGNSDLNTAIDAVNRGHIFRFMTKPCAYSVLTASLDTGLRQYRLAMAEKDLLEKTLVETVNMLTDLLSIVNPAAYGKTLRIRQYVSHICRELKLEESWQYEMAASVSQLGWVIFPPDMIERMSHGQPPMGSDKLMFSKHPFVTKKLLNRIPRLELVARIVEGQESPKEFLRLDKLAGNQYMVDLGSHILRVCLDYDALIEKKLTHQQAMQQMIASKQKYQPDILNALSSMHIFMPVIPDKEPELVKVEDLESDMILVESVKDKQGTVLAEKGALVTRPLMVKLISMNTQIPGSVIEPFRVVRY